MNLKRNINTDLIFFLVLLWAILPAVFYSQSIVLGPPLGYSGSSSSPKIKIFFNSSESVNLQWGKNLPGGYKFRIGSSTGNYNRGSVPVSGTFASFSPSSVNLSSGRYYGVITNSSQDNLSGIQSDYLANPKSIDYSNQIEFIVEAPNAPSPSEPKGSITTATPYFKWNSIPGVKAYWLIVSSTKFSVVTQDNGEVTVQGANILWNYLTTSTSVLYGSDNSNSPMPSAAPPLTSNNTYYYTILNVYDDNDVTYTSSVFGGVESFTYKSETATVPPQLVAPANRSTFYGSNTIQFQWSPVANANSYGVFLLQRVSSFAGNDQQIDIPVWSTTTTNTSVDFPAKSVLTKGKYIWYVVPKDNTGSGSKSDNYEFDYIVKLGKFSASVKSASDGSGIMGFELYPTAISGGSTPANPFIASNSLSYTDSLVVGSYLFKAKKSGYYDSTMVVNITSDKMSYFSIYLRPYPAKVSGKVVDQSGAPVNSALVRFTNLLN
ncbi:MAG: hypothetical protein Q8858_17155 [Bacteroidota bacterium]|nr:hypothetical protein [Bacteroidota bacterium]